MNSGINILKLIVVPAQAGVILPQRLKARGFHRSPRTSGGDPYMSVDDLVPYAVVPAQAGVILDHKRFVSIQNSSPRTSGGDPIPVGECRESFW